MGEGEVVTKSGLMVGLGETHEELVDTFAVLREHGVQVLTVGQYLRPSERHLPVVRYWHPDEFAALRDAPPTSSASTTSRRGRWCARATTPTSTSRRRGRAPGRSRAPARRETDRPASACSPAWTGEPRIVCADPPRATSDHTGSTERAMTRTVVLAVALIFILGFAFLTVSAALNQGITIASLLSAFILLLLFVGIVGALFNPPRR